MAQRRREVEIKLPVAGVDEGRRALRAAGFQVSRRRVFEANVILETAGQGLRRSGSLLRVREAGSQGLLTFKGPALPGKHKDREELEVGVEDSRTLLDILGRLGYKPAFRYEKYRTEYRRPGESGLATLDETPIGVYLELEGAPGWIDRTARKLGFKESSYISASYYALYADSCRKHGIRPSHMTFHRSQRG